MHQTAEPGIPVEVPEAEDAVPVGNRLDPAARLTWIALVAILALALALRLTGIAYDYPFLLDVDENNIYLHTLQMLSQHSIDPRFYFYGPFLHYIDALWLLPYLAVQVVRGYPGVPGVTLYASWTGTTTDPVMHVYARLPYVLLAVFSVWLAYMVGNRFGGRVTGLLAALFLALSPLDISESPLILPNLFLALFALLTLWPTMAYLNRPAALLRSSWVGDMSASWMDRLRARAGAQPRYLVLAAAATGAGTALKFNAVVLLGLPILAVLLVSWGDRLRLLRHCLLVCILAGAVYVILTPTLFWTPYQVAHWVGYQAKVYAHVSVGPREPFLTWDGLYLMQNEGFLLLPVAVFGLAFLWLKERRPVDLLLLLSIAAYYLYLGVQTAHFPRNLLLLTPFVSVGGAYVIMRLARVRRPIGPILAVLVALLALVQLGQGTAALVRSYTGPQDQLLARTWLRSHLPAGAHLLADGYTVPPLARGDVRTTYMTDISLSPAQMVHRGITHAVMGKSLWYYCNPTHLRSRHSWIVPVQRYGGEVIFRLVRGSSPPRRLSCE